MAKKSTAEQTAPTETRNDLPAITVTIGRDAANQGGATTTVAQETLDSLQARHGAPRCSATTPRCSACSSTRP